MSTVEEDSQLDREREQLFRDWDLDDDWSDDRRSPQPFYRSRERGYGADNGWRATTPVAICAGVQGMPATSTTRVHEEAAQPAEAVGRDVPAVREEKLTTSGMSAGAVADATDEERRAALRADHQARLAEVRARHHAQLAAMKQHLPSLAARLRKLW
jgi:hypothetical protein